MFSEGILEPPDLGPHEPPLFAVHLRYLREQVPERSDPAASRVFEGSGIARALPFHTEDFRDDLDGTPQSDPEPHVVIIAIADRLVEPSDRINPRPPQGNPPSAYE